MPVSPTLRSLRLSHAYLDEWGEIPPTSLANTILSVLASYESYTDCQRNRPEE